MNEDCAHSVTLSRIEYIRLLALAADSGPADSIETFCFSEKISPAFFFKMRSEGWGPAVVYYGSLARILPAAKRKWREERTAAAAAGIRRGLTTEAAEGCQSSARDSQAQVDPSRPEIDEQSPDDRTR
jgi:hypothetical protein